MAWPVLAFMAASALASYQSGKSNQRSANRSMSKGSLQDLLNYKRLLSDWKKYAFPNQGAMQAEQSGARNLLGQAYQGMGDKVFSQSASRGFGPGSGLTMKSLGDVQGSYMQSLSQMLTNLAKFKNTPQWSAPGSIGGTNVPIGTSGQGAMWNSIADMAGTGAGFSLMSNYLNPGGGNLPGYSTDYGVQFGVANPKYGW